MNIDLYLKQAQRLVIRNSPVILTSFAVAGVISSVVLAVKATPKAIKILEEHQDKSIFGKAAKVWHLYIPALSISAVTIGCIVGSHSVSTRRHAALASAYSVATKAFEEYQEQVVEELGDKETKIRDAVARNRVEQNPPNMKEVFMTEGGEVLFLEAWTNRYFKSDMESVRRAMNDFNFLLNNDFYASLNRFFQLLGIPSTMYGDDVGWNSDTPLELIFSTQLSDDGRPCVFICYETPPRTLYDRVN